MSDDLTPVVSDTQVEREKFLPFQEWHSLAAGVLFGNFSEVLLNLYRDRSVAVGAR
jgi:hypothetical protein